MVDYPNQPKWKFAAEIFGFVNTLRRGPVQAGASLPMQNKFCEVMRIFQKNQRSCNRFINFRQHDRAFLVPDFLTKLPVKPPYMAIGPCTAKFVYITAMQFHTS